MKSKRTVLLLKIHPQNNIQNKLCNFLDFHRSGLYYYAVKTSKRDVEIDVEVDIIVRFVLRRSISEMMDARWCCDLLSQTIEKQGVFEVFNTNQGNPFSAPESTIFRNENGVKVSINWKKQCSHPSLNSTTPEYDYKIAA